MTNRVQTVLSVSGMSCGNCVQHVTQALRTLQGVDAVEVSLADARVVVRHDPSVASLSHLIAAVSDAGYDATQPR